MRILIAEDDLVSRRLLESMIVRWGYEVEVTQDGTQAWDRYQNESGPILCVLDWSMPGLDGVQVCRNIRSSESRRLAYVILLTAMDGTNNKVEGLHAGADDYVTKPFDPAELQARIEVGARVIQLQAALADRVTELEVALAKIKTLQGLVPICASCKNIRDDKGYWNQIEAYISEHTNVELSHGICPDCFKDLYPDFADRLSTE